jgi:hypothetical protein
MKSGLKAVYDVAAKQLSIYRLEPVRDIFLFCGFTGLDYSDVNKL